MATFTQFEATLVLTSQVYLIVACILVTMTARCIDDEKDDLQLAGYN